MRVRHNLHIAITTPSEVSISSARWAIKAGDGALKLARKAAWELNYAALSTDLPPYLRKIMTETCLELFRKADAIAQALTKLENELDEHEGIER